MQSTACLVDLDWDKQNWEAAKKFPKEMTCSRWEIRKKKRKPKRGEIFFDEKSQSMQIFDGKLWLEMK